MINRAVRTLAFRHVPQWSGTQIFLSGCHGKMCWVDTATMHAGRSTPAFTAPSGLVVTDMIDVAIRKSEHEPMGIDGLSFKAEPAIAVRLDMSRIPWNAGSINHAPIVAIWGRLDGRPVLPDFTDGMGSI